MPDFNDVLVPAPNVLSSRAGDELVIVLPTDGRFIVLNKTGTAVFQMLNGKRSLREIAAALSEKYGVPEERAKRDVLAFAEKLLSCGAAILITGGKQL